MAFEIGQPLSYCQVMHITNGGRSLGRAQAVEEGDGLRGGEGEVEAGDSAGRYGPLHPQLEPTVRSDPGQQIAEVFGAHPTVQPEVVPTAPYPAAGGLTCSGVVLLTTLGHHAQVVRLSADDHLADGKHGNGPVVPASAGRSAEPHHLEQSRLGHNHPPPQADDGQVAASRQLVGEGTRDTEQSAGLGHRQNETITGNDRNRANEPARNWWGHFVTRGSVLGQIHKAAGGVHAGIVRFRCPYRLPQQCPKSEFPGNPQGAMRDRSAAEIPG